MERPKRPVRLPKLYEPQKRGENGRGWRQFGSWRALGSRLAAGPEQFVPRARLKRRKVEKVRQCKSSMGLKDKNDCLQGMHSTRLQQTQRALLQLQLEERSLVHISYAECGSAEHLVSACPARITCAMVAEGSPKEHEDTLTRWERAGISVYRSFN